MWQKECGRCLQGRRRGLLLVFVARPAVPRAARRQQPIRSPVAPSVERSSTPLLLAEEKGSYSGVAPALQRLKTRSHCWLGRGCWPRFGLLRVIIGAAA